MRIDVIVRDKPSLNNPVIICGLPGSAFVGKFAVDHLIEELSAKPLADFYSAGFPPQVVIGEDGIGNLMKNEALYWKNSVGKSDLIFYTGDAQPATSESEYELSEAVIDFLAKEHKANELVTLGAFVTGKSADTPKVYSSTTDHALAQKMEAKGCVLMTDGAITGMNGLFLGLARLKGLSGYTLLGETSGLSFDARASEVILTVLSDLLGVKMDYKKLEQRAKEAQEAVKAIEAIRRERAREEQLDEGGPSRRLDYIS
ncbi:MAG: PAC2 family protein [Nitrososphaerales archaeon]